LLEAEGSLNTVSGSIEMDVHEDEIWAKVVEEAEGVVAGGASAHDTVTEIIQKRGYVTADETFILDDKYADSVKTGHLELAKPS
jgi:hypothetical protein